MSHTAIQVENLGKRYRIGKRESYYRISEVPYRLVSQAGTWLKRRFQRRPPSDTGSTPGSDRGEFWALQDVSFDVPDGEVLGIIGRNGAGKSTLLKLLTRITRPTTGQIRLRGRVSSLLEVGTGFHPELTGRENVFLNGTILGMRKAEVDRKFDEIVAFAEVEKFLDTPVKHFSSGMYVRLAFAVAAHLEPEILLIDEVLAVGDAEFQKKCLGKMGQVARGGRTVFFVSHNMAAVQSLCTSAIWLNSGTLKQKGCPHDVVQSYLKTAEDSVTEQVWDTRAAAPGNDKIRLHRASVRPLGPCGDDPITVRTPLEVAFDYWNLTEGAVLSLSVVVSDAAGSPLFNTVPAHDSAWMGRPLPRGLFRSTFRIPGDLLNDGTHHLQLYVVQDLSHCIYQHDDIVVFHIRDDFEARRYWFGKRIGAVRPRLEWTTDLLEPLPASEGMGHLGRNGKRTP